MGFHHGHVLLLFLLRAPGSSVAVGRLTQAGLVIIGSCAEVNCLRPAPDLVGDDATAATMVLWSSDKLAELAMGCGTELIQFSTL